MEHITQSAVEDFTLARSGRLNTILRWMRLKDDTRKGYVKRSLVLMGVTWLPLLILSALQGLAWGDRVDMNFLKDFSIHFKFILVLPLLIFSESSVDRRLSELTAEFFKSGILEEKDLPALDRIKKRIKQLSETAVADMVILTLVITNIFIRWLSNMHNISIWMLYPDQQGEHISRAGYWYAFFSLPVFQYILFRWIWRWVLWFIYFLKICQASASIESGTSRQIRRPGFPGNPTCTLPACDTGSFHSFFNNGCSKNILASSSPAGVLSHDGRLYSNLHSDECTAPDRIFQTHVQTTPQRNL